MRKWYKAMNLEDGIKAARDNSIPCGGIWVVWEDGSRNAAIRVTRFEAFEEEATNADFAFRCDEDGEESR